MSILAQNRRANFDFDLLEKYEAGLVLLGQEVKSVKSGQVSLKGAYVSLKIENNKVNAYLLGAHIARYQFSGGLTDYDPIRERKLLLSKRELNRLNGKIMEKGLTLIPLKMYTKRSFVKLEFALVRGKKKFDKRESIKKRELDRQLRTLTKNRER
ncbi:MAG: SsrA-binding protein SmpB [Clostridia bacterium]|nr:SsrA-binding protein SmpB [Clostridia bacterium]